MYWSEILKFFLSTTVITGGIVFIAKIFIEKFAESRIEKYKSDLEQDTENFKHQLSLETERFRNELNISSSEHQIRYSKLYEERGYVIKKLYGLLLNLENSLSELTTPFQAEWFTDTERDKKATDDLSEVGRELELNRLFFSDVLCKQIESILDDSKKIIIDMMVAKRKEQRVENYIRTNREISQDELVEPLNKWIELDEKVKTEIKTARLNLAEEFRRLIGVN